MAAQRKCRACGKPFEPDYRTQANQAFCPRPECRRSRRAQAQRKRRNQARQDESLTRRLKPSEARWLRKNPMIIGLVSVLIGSTDLQQIETFCAAAILRGTKILDRTLAETESKPVVNQGWNDQKLP
jgi:hypothetical protein